MVCDGHAGKKVAETVSANLPFLLKKAVKESELKTAKAIYQIVNDYASTFVKAASGSTLTGFLATSSTIYFYNIGDSRTVLHFEKPGTMFGWSPETGLSRKSVEQVWSTADHAHTDPKERKRVKEAGGSIFGGRLNGILAMTRSIGDDQVGSGLSHSPDVSWTSLNGKCKTVLCMSDGVYDNTKKDSHFLWHINEKYGPSVLVNWATESGSGDNITALSVELPA